MTAAEQVQTDVRLEIWETPEGHLQLSIGVGGLGYRLMGPKFDGRSWLRAAHQISERDVQEMLRYLNQVAS